MLNATRLKRMRLSRRKPSLDTLGLILENGYVALAYRVFHFFFYRYLIKEPDI